MKKLLITLFVCSTFHLMAQSPSDAYIESIMDAGKLPGAEAVIIKNGSWVYDHGWGLADIPGSKPVTRHSVFMLASVSKTMIATSLMMLWERGAFRLDDNINHYLPFNVINPSHPEDSITFRTLVTHTSSIQDNLFVLDSIYVYGDSPVSLDSFLRNYFVPEGSYYDRPRNFYTYHSGIGYNYSNIGATLAAYLVQRISGDDYSHFCDTAIFEKLCMDHTSYLLSGFSDTSLIARPYSWNGSGYDDDGLYGYPDYPDGQLRTDITALSRFMTMYMQYGVYNGTRLLDSTTVALIMSTQYPSFPGQGIIFGARTIPGGDILWGHYGGDAGASTAMCFSYIKKTGVIVLTNGDGQNTIFTQKILDTLYHYGQTISPGPSDTFPACTWFPADINNPAEAVSNQPDIYPNPVNDNLTINMGGSALPIGITLTITNILGVTLFELKDFKGAQADINTTLFTPGLYLLTIQNGNQKTVSKFVKN